MGHMQETGNNAIAELYRKGTSVFDAQGEKLGTLSFPPLLGKHLVVEQGWLFIRHLYIPLTAIHARDVNGVYLNLTKEEMEGELWRTPPEAETAVEAALPPEPPEVRPQ